MKLGDIKTEALKLMFVNYNEDIGAEQLNDLMGDEMYGSYLTAMTGSINRCFSDLEIRGVLPAKSFVLPAPDESQKGTNIEFKLGEVIPDIFSAERLVYRTAVGEWEDGDIADRILGNTLILPYFDDRCESYTLVYRPRIARIFPYTAPDTELDIPDHIASFIPYWIKGELFRDDEPNEAGEARNWYESHMSMAENNASRRYGQVRTIYSQTEV